MPLATITKSANAPVDVDNFSIGQVDFTLNETTPSFVTEDQAVIGNARANAWLDIEFAAAPVDPDAPPVDPNDPHTNPEADHLSAQASPAAISAANANQAAIADIVTGETSVGQDGPTTAETVAATLAIVGVDSSELPFTPAATTTTAPAVADPAPTAEADKKAPSTPAAPAVTTTSTTDSAAATTTGAIS